jgi:hypothetical protein
MTEEQRKGFEALRRFFRGDDFLPIVSECWGLTWKENLTLVAIADSIQELRSQLEERTAIPQQPQGEICCTGCKNLMPNGERDCGMNFPPCYKSKLSPVW